MGLDINKYCSIAALSLLIVLILFTNLRHCFAEAATTAKTKVYEGEGCTKLAYMNINSDHHCPGEGSYAIAGQCLEYIECTKSTVQNSSTEYLDYFQICDEQQYFNGTGCSNGDGDCVQKYCKIIEIELNDGPAGEEGPAPATADLEGHTTMVSTSVDEVAAEARTESHHSNGNSSSRSGADAGVGKSGSMLLQQSSITNLCSGTILLFMLKPTIRSYFQ